MLNIENTTTHIKLIIIPITVRWKIIAVTPPTIMAAINVTMGCHHGKCQKLHTNTTK